MPAGPVSVTFLTCTQVARSRNRYLSLEHTQGWFRRSQWQDIVRMMAVVGFYTLAWPQNHGGGAVIWKLQTGERSHLSTDKHEPGNDSPILCPIYILSQEQDCKLHDQHSDFILDRPKLAVSAFIVSRDRNEYKDFKWMWANLPDVCTCFQVQDLLHEAKHQESHKCSPPEWKSSLRGLECRPHILIFGERSLRTLWILLVNSRY